MCLPTGPRSARVQLPGPAAPGHPQCLQGAYAARLRLTGKGLQRSASSIRCDKLPGGPPGRYGPSSPSTSPNESRRCGPIQPQTKMAGRVSAGTDLPRSPRGRASAGSRGRFEDRHRWGFVMAFSRTDLYDAVPMRCGFVCQSSLFQTDELHIRGFTSLPPCGPSRARPTGSPDRWPHLIIRCGGAYARAHKAVRLDLTGSPNKECLTSSSRRGTASQPRFRRTGPAASRRRSSAERTGRSARLD